MTKFAAACMACIIVLPAALKAQGIRHYTTTQHTPFTAADCVVEGSPLAFEKKKDYGRTVIFVDSAKQFQTIEGFGGAFTEAGASVLKKMSPAKQEMILKAYFGEGGNNYTLCRTHINSCDFSLGNYAYDETPGDTTLSKFTIEHDKQALLPMIQSAMKMNKAPIKIFASPWSPPAWMKTNGEMNHGGKLKPEYTQVWADYFSRYIREYAKEGVKIWGVTVQNEPAATQSWDSCQWTAEEERDFVRDHLGPTLEKAGQKDVKIMIWDHNRDLLVPRAAIPYSDPAASKYIWGAAIHWYENPPKYDNMTLIHDAWPDKAIIFSEGCQEGGAHNGEWAPAERYGHNMINDLNHWAAGWTDWNMLLDEKGGPNHVGNFCHAPILANAATDTVMLQPSYFYIAHFSRFIQPGAKRVLCGTQRESLEAAAFLNPDGTTIVVVMNRDSREEKFSIETLDSSVATEIPGHSIKTFVISK